MAAPSRSLSSSIPPPSTSPTPALSLPSTVRFERHTRRAVSERHPIPSFAPSPGSSHREPPRVTIDRADSRDELERTRRPSTESSSHASLSSNALTDNTANSDILNRHDDEDDDSQPSSALEMHVGPKASTHMTTTSADAGDGPSHSTTDSSALAPVDDSSESIADRSKSSLLSPNTNGSRPRRSTITWGGSARAYPLSPPLETASSANEPAGSPFFQAHPSTSRVRSASASHRHQQSTQPRSASSTHKRGPSASTSSPSGRRKPRPPALQTDLLSPSASSFNYPSASASQVDYPPPSSGRSSSSTSPLRHSPSAHDPRQRSPARSPSVSGSHLLASISDSEEDESTSNHSPSRRRTQSAMSPSAPSGNRPSSRSVSISSSVHPSNLRRNSSSSSALHLSGREGSISRKGKERERDAAAEKERERRERKAAERKEKDRARRYREMQHDQVGRHDFGFGYGGGSALTGSVGPSTSGTDMFGLGGGMRSLDPANEATLDTFLGQTDLRAALRSVSTAASNGPPPPSPSQLPASQTGSVRSTPSKSKTAGPPTVLSPTSSHFPPTPTQTSFPLFRRQSTQDSIVSPTSGPSSNGRTRTPSHSSALALGPGKTSGKDGAGADKLKKVFAFAAKAPDKIVEPVATGPEGEAKLLSDFEAQIRRAEAALISHPNTLAAADLYKTAMTHRYAVIFQPLAAGEKPLSLLDVARWKEKTLEVQRRGRALESSRAARSVVDGEGWRSTDSFKRGASTSLGSQSLSRTGSIAIPGRPATGANMSQSSFEDGSVNGQLRNFRFGGPDATLSTQRSSRSSTGFGSAGSHHPYLLSPARKERVSPWIVDPHDVVLFADSDGKIDETLDVNGGRRSPDEYHSLSRVGSALPSVQEVLDGPGPSSIGSPGSPSTSPYGLHRAEHAALYPSPDRYSSRRSLSPLPGSSSRPSSPLAGGQTNYFPLPNSGLSPPRPPTTLNRSPSYTRPGASRTKLASLITSPSQLSRPHLGEHVVATPATMTPSVVNLSDRRGSLPDGGSVHLPRHMHHQSLSGVPTGPRNVTKSLTARGSVPSSPHPGGLSPPAPSYGHSRPTHNRRVSDQPPTLTRLTPSTPIHPKPSYHTRAKAANKKLADGLDSAGSGDELSRAGGEGGNRSEGDVPGGRATKSSLSKRSFSHQEGPQGHFSHLIKNRVGGLFTNSRDVSPQGSDAEDGPLPVGATGMKKVASVASSLSGAKGRLSGKFRMPGTGSRRGMAGLEMTKGGESEFREHIGLGLDEVEGYEPMVFEGRAMDEFDVNFFERRKDWELDRERDRDELEAERREIESKAEFLTSTRAKLPTYATFLTHSQTTLRTLHSHYLAYPAVAKDRFHLVLPSPALPPHLLESDDLLPPVHVLLPSVATLVQDPLSHEDDTLGPLSTTTRPRSNSISTKPRRRSSISAAAAASAASGGGSHFQLQRQLLKHQAAAAAALEEEEESTEGERQGQEKKKKKDLLAELETGLEEVTKGWEELYEWARRIVRRREELYGRFERSEGEFERVVRGRERKRRLLEPSSIDLAPSRSNGTDAILGAASEMMLNTFLFGFKFSFVSFSYLFLRNSRRAWLFRMGVLVFGVLVGLYFLGRE